MIDGLTVTFAGILQSGAIGILSLAVLMLFTGRLFTRRHVDDMRTDRDARIADAKEITQTWRTAYEASEAARRETETLVRESLETSRAVLHIVQALRTASGGVDVDTS